MRSKRHSVILLSFSRLSAVRVAGSHTGQKNNSILSGMVLKVAQRMGVAGEQKREEKKTIIDDRPFRTG